MKYLLIDTNIYIQCCLLELEGDDHGVLKKLHSLLEENKLTLLLPEVIQLEFEKNLQEKFEKIKNQIGRYKEAINKDGELDSKVKKDLMSKLTECSDERARNKSEGIQTIKKIFQHKNTQKIKLNSLAMENAYRRFLANKKPYSKREDGQIQPDCLLVEGVNEYLKDKTDYELFLCSANKDDFSDNPKEKDQPIIIARDISANFSNIKYYVNLFQCFDENFQTKYPKKVIEKVSNDYYQPEKQNVYFSAAQGGLTVNPQLFTPYNAGAAMASGPSITGNLYSPGVYPANATQVAVGAAYENLLADGGITVQATQKKCANCQSALGTILSPSTSICGICGFNTITVPKKS